MVGHGGDPRLRRDAPTCATSPATCCASAPTRAAASASPAGSGCAAPTRMFAADAPVDRAPPRGAAGGARAGQPLRPRRRHAGADPQPPRPLPRRAGAGVMPASRSTASRSRSPPGTTVLDAARAAGSWVPTLCFDERQAPVRRLPRLPGRRRRARPGRARLHHALPRRDGGRHRGRRPRAGSPARSSSWSSPSCPSRPRRTPSSPRSPRRLGGRRAALARRRRTPREDDLRHPYLALRHELCISCGRCVRACDEVQGAFALTATGRGFEANIAAGLDAGFEDSTCVVLRRLRRHLPDRRDHRDPPAAHARDRTGEVRPTDDRAALRPRRRPRPAATAASAAGSRRTRATAAIVSITPGARRPRQRGPHLPQGPLRPPVHPLTATA